LFGLGWPQWLLIIGLLAGLILTFKIMARASIAYAKARENREKQALVGTSDPADDIEQNEGESR
jgi:hypothetical protein